MHGQAEGLTERRTAKQRGREHATGTTDPDRETGGTGLANEQYEQKANGIPAINDMPKDRITDPVHFRKSQQQAAKEQPANSGPRPLRTTPQVVAQVLDRVQHLGKQYAARTRDQPQ